MSQFVHMMGQIQRLKNGVGLQALLDAAYAILGNPIALFNTEYHLLAYTEVVTDDPLWNELITLGTFSASSLQLFDSEGFIEDVANAPRCALLHSEKLKYDRISGKVFSKYNTYVLNTIIVACNKPFEDYDLMVFDAVNRLISREISLNNLYHDYEQAHQESIIKSLLEGTFDRRMDVGQVSILYGTLDSSLYTAVAELSHCSPELSAAQVRDLFKETEPAFKYAVYETSVLLLISTNEDSLDVMKTLHKLIPLFEQHHIYVGLSSRFENLFELRKHYNEALKALQYILDCKCARHVFPCHPSSMEAMEKIQALDNRYGIQYMLDKGPRIFNNPLLFHDLELNLLAYSEKEEIIDPVWEELITYGTSSNETINLFRTEGFVATMESVKGGAVLISDKIKYDRISWKVYNSDNIMIGCLSIVNTVTPFTEDTLVLMGALGQKLSRIVGEIDFYNKYGRLYSETVINRLLSGKIDDYTFYTEDIANLYDNLLESLYLVVVNASQFESGQASLSYFRDLFHHLDAVTRYAVYADHIIIIISTTGGSPSEDNEPEEIRMLLEQHHIYAGISRCFDNIYDLQTYYKETVDALQSGIANSGSSQWVFRVNA